VAHQRAVDATAENRASEAGARLGGGAFVLGGLSYIPLIGVVFGLAAIVWGLVSRKKGAKKLALVGAGGIAFTFVLYGSLFYFGFVQRGGIYDSLRAQSAQHQLNQLVQSIELYKVAHGEYPASLAQLQEGLGKAKGMPVFVYDPMDVGSGLSPRYFYYERVGTDRYRLRGIGFDGQPFTSDDIVPQVDDALAGKIGLVVEPPARH
jgi:hypothetical protein